MKLLYIRDPQHNAAYVAVFEDAETLFSAPVAWLITSYGFSIEDWERGMSV